MLRGTGVSAGVATGTAFVIACGNRMAAPQRSILSSEVAGERSRFEAALARASSELVALQDDVSERIGRSQADIFGAQLLVLEDRGLRDRVLRIVEEKRINVEAALSEIVDGYVRTLDAVPDTYIRERAADVRDVGRRVLSSLVDRQASGGPDIPAGAVVVAVELLPSVTARLQLDRVGALVTERGNKFSHSSILARSLGTPAVVGVPEASLRIKTGDRLIVDGVAGVVFVNPERSVEREYDRVEAALRADKEGLQHLVGLPSVTRDGTAIPLLANVNKLADTEAALRCQADGIGLYRTEFAFSIRPRFPTEEEQYEYLARAAERFHPRKVVFRLLDLGGDKTLPYFPLAPSRNPSLGPRGVRLLRQVQGELSAAGKRFDPRVPVGAMIEVPSAALMAGAISREVDFLSLGTNDLVQYLLAADREDESIAPYYQPLHPAVLRLIHSVAESARSAGRELTICGEMAGDPLHTELLLGLGLRALSVAPGEMLEVKDAIRAVRLDEARELAGKALELGSVAEIEALLHGRRAERREP